MSTCTLGLSGLRDREPQKLPSQVDQIIEAVDEHGYFDWADYEETARFYGQQSVESDLSFILKSLERRGYEKQGKMIRRQT